ncbi:hypothetical protein GF312_05480 [Candidatus Poribacteria bacterium]|nr:hypothetical protein [Candidatus Poribacteria bacterium]
MITITNDKITGFKPRWASFRGFSLLFDNPGVNVAMEQNLFRLNCCVDTDPELRLYKAFEEALKAIGRDIMLNTYLLCLLPSYSYHVTTWDGVNDSNIDQLNRDKDLFSKFLDELPECMLEKVDFIDLIQESALISDRDWSLLLKFHKLEKWNNKALVATLQTFDDKSNQVLEWIKANRARLSRIFGDKYGIDLSSNFPYVPHVTLGYYANDEHAELSTPSIDLWNSIFLKYTKNLQIEFTSISIYAFSNMVTSFRKSDEK